MEIKGITKGGLHNGMWVYEVCAKVKDEITVKDLRLNADKIFSGKLK